MGAGHPIHRLTRVALFSAWSLVACSSSDDPVEDTGFRVVSTVPVDGELEAVEAQTPELRVNADADQTTCTADTMRLDGLTESGVLAFAVDFELRFVDGGSKILFDHADVLPDGYTYALTVPVDSACTDTEGRLLQPFGAEFFVP